MTDGTPANENTAPSSPNPPSRGRGRIAAIVAAAMAATGAGFFAGSASSHGFGPSGHFGPRHGFMRVFAPANVGEAEDRARRMARHLAVEIDASADQETKLIALAKGVAADVFPLREKMIDARKRGLELLKSPTVDRAAIEQLRSEQMANFDAISKRVTTALADAGDVLTPDQRSKLAERIEQFRERRGWWHRGSRD